MEMVGSVVAVYGDYNSAEAAVKKLIASGFELKNLSVVGEGYHKDENVVGFYTTGDRVKFWGTRGAFWGGFWGLLFGGLFMTIPVVGHVVVLGYLATVVFAGIENAIVVGGLSALGAALYSLGIPKDSVLAYETAIKADDFLVMARGSRRRNDARQDNTRRDQPLSPGCARRLGRGESLETSRSCELSERRGRGGFEDILVKRAAGLTRAPRCSPVCRARAAY